MALLRELRLIELQTSRLVDQHLAGSYLSIFKGQGVAFAEVRPYEAGDDVRAIHWKVTARTGAPHIKLFTEERELTLMLVVDMSGSLDLGSREVDKRHLVARLAATFAFSAIRNNDRVGLIGVTDKVEIVVPPRSGRKHVLSVIQKVLTHEPHSRNTRHEAGLEYLARLGTHGAVVIAISDFIAAVEPQAKNAPISRFERALKLVRRRNDVIPVRVEDPIELELPALGLVAMEDLEALGLDEVGLWDLSPSRTRAYAQAVAAEREAFEALMRRLHLEVLSVRCGEPWEKPMVHFFERRARRLRG
jgi:uncharacterized protein (DUF58 family)